MTAFAEMPWRCLRFGVGAAVFASGLGACGADYQPGAPPSASGCPVLEAGAPDTVDAEVRVLASGQRTPVPFNSAGPELISDGGDVYWYDGDGSVFVQRAGEAGVVELTRSDHSARWQIVMGMAANAERLYVGDGFRPTYGLEYVSLSDFTPPSRLFSISKQEGRVEVLLEEQTHTLFPIFADAERVVVFASGADSGYYQVRLADPQLERLPVAASFGRRTQLVGDQLYWLSEEHPPSLLRSGFDDAEPETVMRLYVDDSFFSIGPDYTLALEGRILPGYYYVGADFVLHDDSGCRALPAPRLNFAGDAALDRQFVYWYRYRRPTQLTLPPDEFTLFRVDIESGALTQVNTPGFTAEPDVRIVGQDDTRLFLRSSGTLVAVQKP